MKSASVVFISFLVLSLACKTDYDISEVASPEFLGAVHEEAAQDSTHVESQKHDPSQITETERHVHDPGVRNHGTTWFFNQPWAASFIWGKMIRDSIILLILAGVILFASGHRRKHR